MGQGNKKSNEGYTMSKAILLSIAMVLIFVGCGSKKEKSLGYSLEQRLVLDKNMQKTEKVTIRDVNETKITLTASYLNSIESLSDKHHRVTEKFIIGLYQVGGVSDEALINDNQQLTINVAYPEPTKGEEFNKKERKERAKGMDKLPIIVKRLSQNDPILKNRVLVNSWSSYYYAEFPHSIKEKFTLTYQNKIYGQKKVVNSDGNETIKYTKYTMPFAKKGKYVVNNMKKFR